MLHHRIVFTLLYVVLFSGSIQAAIPFKDGDRWTMVGDSITHGGEYHTWVYLYFLTRFPEMELRVANAGNSGDDAHGALERYDWDIIPKQGTVASVMFGMNDVRREIYGDVEETNQIRDQRIYILEGYRSFMTKLVQQLEADDYRIILFTPTPYDETAQHDRDVLTGVNGALGECADFVTQLAERYGAILVDFYGPMNAINERMQSEDPAASLIKTDRVHPNPVGQFVMAYLFLKAVDAPQFVSSVQIDLANPDAVELINASISELEVGENELSFTLNQGAIPFPVGKAQQPALEWVPFQEDLNREILQVSGLANGEYRLSIDGEVIRTFQSEALAGGVNLALESNTPQALQSAEVLKQIQAWHRLALEYRSIASFEFWQFGNFQHPIQVEQVRDYIDAEIERLEPFTTGPNSWKRNRFIHYLDRKPREASIRAEMSSMIDQIRTEAQPHSHHYRLQRVLSADPSI